MVSSERKGPQLLSGPRRLPHPALRESAAMAGGSQSASFISACVTQERQEGKGGRWFNESCFGWLFQM